VVHSGKRTIETIQLFFVYKNSFCGETGKEKCIDLKIMEKNFVKKYSNVFQKAIILPKLNVCLTFIGYIKNKPGKKTTRTTHPP
jgi:hypothetical protein